MEATLLLSDLGIAHTIMNEAQVDEHKQAWVKRLVPPENQQKAADCYCLPKGDGFSNYLWHAFSFELVEALRGDEARTAFDEAQKGNAVLLSNWDDAGFLLPDSSMLTSTTLDEIADVVITSRDFKWTYAKTHEGDFGPYFLKNY